MRKKIIKLCTYTLILTSLVKLTLEFRGSVLSFCCVFFLSSLLVVIASKNNGRLTFLSGVGANDVQ